LGRITQSEVFPTILYRKVLLTFSTPYEGAGGNHGSEGRKGLNLIKGVHFSIHWPNKNGLAISMSE